MPLARIDLPAGKPPGYGPAVADAVYEALIATLNVPRGDRFQVISEHSRDTLLIDPTYLGIDRSVDALLIQVTLSEGRTVEVKKAFYKAVADELHERPQTRGRFHQPCRGEEGKLVVRQRRSPVRRIRAVKTNPRELCQGHRGPRCENHAKREKHRTEVTEVTEGGLV
jgi:4-oxalocrotonate tautomerase